MYRLIQHVDSLEYARYAINVNIRVAHVDSLKNHRFCHNNNNDIHSYQVNGLLGHC